MTRVHSDYLHDILSYIEKAQRFVSEVDFESFQANDEKALAVIRALEVIGEAVKFIPETERQRYPEIPWRAVAGMRDKLIHGYFSVNLNRVWETVQRDLPLLKEVVSQMIVDLEKADSEKDSSQELDK